MMYLFFVAFTVLFHYGQGQRYKAAVLEFYPSTEDTPEATMLKNLNRYREYADKASTQAVDILVFPEYGLTTLVVDPEEYAIDFSQNGTKILEELSDMALERQMYLVVNLLEKVKEDNRKTKYYNTNVVYDRGGVIIAKYRKINLYGEPKLTPGTELVTFTTNFQVTFGLFTCFDLFFDNPSRTILNNTKVTDVIVPLAWFSTTPFYTALSIQHGYALSTGTNLLAANYDSPRESHGGSGIFLADGSVSESYIAATNSTKLIVQEVPISTTRQENSACKTITGYALPGDSTTPNLTDYITRKEFKASKYEFKKIDLSQANISTEVCQGNFCCTFNITIKQPAPTNEIYKLVIFNKDSFTYNDNQKAYISVCSLVACQDDSNDSCGARTNSTAKFTKISVGGTFQKDTGAFFIPTSLKVDLKTVGQSLYCENRDGNTTVIKFATLQAQEGILAYGIVGKSPSSSSTIHSLGVFFIVLLSAAKIVLF